MWQLLRRWFKDYFADPEVAILLICVILGVLLLVSLGHIFAPLLAGFVIAYLLESAISPVQKYLKLPRSIAVTVVYILFLGCVIFLVLGLLPLVWRQLLEIANNWPQMVDAFRGYVLDLPKQYPSYISVDLVQEALSNTAFGLDHLMNMGKGVLTYTFNSLPNLLSGLVYIFLVPLSVFFFLKDKLLIQRWANRHLPEERGLLESVAREMKAQIGNYVRGKFLEVVIVGVFTYIGFRVFNLNYAVLLAVGVGLSAIIPYVGMVVITIPVAIIGLMQYGMTPAFIYMFAVYLAIQAIDGNVLVPLLFSEAVNLHPMAIIAAVLFFGSVWGFWGLFFAIPLATLVNAIVSAWVGHAVASQKRRKLLEAPSVTNA